MMWQQIKDWCTVQCIAKCSGYKVDCILHPFDPVRTRSDDVPSAALISPFCCLLQETFAHYTKSTGHGTDNKVLAALNRWGPNKFEVPIPQFTSLLGEQLLAPFFCFQVFCVGLWALDEYWYGLHRQHNACDMVWTVSYTS